MIGSVSLLGSTGSVGTQALEVLEDLNIEVVAIAANENIKLLESQARRFKPKLVVVNDVDRYKELKENLNDCSLKVSAGFEGVCEAASFNLAEMVINSIVGISGLVPTVCSLESGKDVAIANKEALVTGGSLITKLAEKKDCKLIPVDSEHSAIFQAIQGSKLGSVSKIILTASGGPFFGRNRSWLESSVEISASLNNPNWKMGRKISVDSATLMNKGLELIEAVWLFNKKPEQIEIVVHPQSILHSAVLFVDGAIIGQFGFPTMKLPIQYALTYPDRVCSSAIKNLSFKDFNVLSFYEPDYETFGCLKLCLKAIEEGGLFPTVVNAANEKAVELFLDGKINFLDIERLVADALLSFKNCNVEVSIKSILETDRKIKSFVEKSVC